ncbi:MAG: flagellar biosynthesis protein FlhB [Pseudomonadota bacterium]
MADEQDAGEKTEEPSTFRIEQFRRRGEVASSRDLTGILLLIGTIMALALSVVYIFETMSGLLEWLYSLNLDVAYSEQMKKMILEKALMALLKCSAPVLISALCIGVMGNIAQIGFLFAPEVLNFNPERINPVTNLRRLFSVRSSLEAVKGIFKFAIVMVIVYMFVKDDLSKYNGFLHLDFIAFFVVAKGMLLKLVYAILLGLLVVAAGDFAYQKFSYRKKIMLSREEAKREHREQEGAPEIKQRIKTIQRSMMQKRMMNNVPKADVIITNPTHLSIALKYDPKTMVSPEVVAKGADFMAIKIREIAKENNIPVVENVPLARTLYKTVKTGATVPRTLYKAVAEVLAFVYKLKRKEKALSW